MQLPESWTERLPFLESLEEDWQRVPRGALVIWIIFYAYFLIGYASNWELPRLIDLVFVPVHEGGHVIFGWFGQFLAVAGGTITQLAAPFLLGTYFAFRRQPQGVAFCFFFFFQQFIPIAAYMSDARAMALPLLSLGGGDDVIHDWNFMLTKLGLLAHDTQLASATRIIGWLGMFAVVIWFLIKGLKSWQAKDPNRSLAF